MNEKVTSSRSLNDGGGTLIITMTDGEVITFAESYWDDYTVILGTNVPSVVVKWKNAWISIFPLANIKHVIMK